LGSHIYAGQDSTFQLDRRFAFANRPLPNRFSLDFGDGSGPHPLGWGDALVIHYQEAGLKTAVLTAVWANGTTVETNFVIQVRPHVLTEPDVSWENLVATIPYLGETAVYDAYIFYGEGHSQVEQPLILVEGFDFGNRISWPEVLAIITEHNLVDDLLAAG
jgi:hypothetical protein